MSLNKVMLIGNVGKEPEIRYLKSETGPQEVNPKVASFSLATTEKYRDRSGKPAEITEWHNIVAWRALADLAEKFIHKGTQIYVEGRIRTRSYTDKGGNTQYRTEIMADAIQLLGRRSDSQARAGEDTSRSEVSAAPAQAPRTTEGAGTDDLPF